jgi:F0F1-type ATP synthase membrane subunit c/vacuolar-type H+-ATPase subunit K
MHWHNVSGWDWFWGTLAMGLWIVVVGGGVVYIAVSLAQGSRRRRNHP